MKYQQQTSEPGSDGTGRTLFDGIRRGKIWLGGLALAGLVLAGAVNAVYAGNPGPVESAAAKTAEQNWELLRQLEELQELGRPILVGVSRKSMLYKALGITPEEAMPATQVVQYAALERGARWLRVHDVAEAARTAQLWSLLHQV